MDTPRWVEKIGVRVLRIHNAVYKGTNGRIGHRFIPGTPPNLLLHTIGAKTGQARSTSLVYFRDDDTYLLVASNGGNPRSPGWYHNLKANPDVEVNVGPKRFGVTARQVLPDDPDYARLWQIANTNFRGQYEIYQRRVSRQIPMLVLTPR
ncbi:MAG: hypothetical protein JWQ81_4650 [Amycolatopsis sp.]|jgi:deazaflavin-dependent oxidoreductase (nitroreductase family)|uniref:nitroreductase family deazaflavin-dependent oxidoreductase n=1 Tax=Amycolatopsis sp. TaxID=37632 RepID=UPI002635D9D5|nr:nitroreductase family deazaflavin-dependent oxidoreductase [Amycolatopsis sp.]MCU1683911.1 hypothetical protein [Amycolatopsis sp.]